MTIAFIVCAILLIAVLAWVFMFNGKKPDNYSNIYDNNQLYLKEVNSFIRREFLFEVHKWITGTSSTINVTNGVTEFLTQVQDPDTLQQKMANITAVIIVKMSKDLKNAFYRQYSKTINLLDSSVMVSSAKTKKKRVSPESSDGLYIYVSRLVYFYIRRIITDTTTLLVTEQNETADKITRDYMIEIEREIYNINDVNVVASYNTSDDNNASTKSKE